LPAPPHPAALFIVFEGIDGSGKTTQARALVRRIHRRGCAARLTHEPGGTPLGEYLRRWLKRRPVLLPLAELTLFIAARAELIENVVKPALESGVTVVSDRYTASTVAYQGHGRGLDLALVDRLNVAATGGLAPNLTVLLDLSPQEALARKGGPPTDAFEAAPLAFHRRVRSSYLDQAADDAGRWLILDATRPQRALSQEIWAKIQPLF